VALDGERKGEDRQAGERQRDGDPPRRRQRHRAAAVEARVGSAVRAAVEVDVVAGPPGEWAARPVPER
jgi:hypothetical protein